MQKLKQYTRVVKIPHSSYHSYPHENTTQSQIQGISTRSTLGLLILTQLKGLARNRVEKLTHQASTLGELQEQFSRQSPQRQNKGLLEHDWLQAHLRAQKIIKEAQRGSISILSIFEQNYPSLLRAIPDRPPVLYLKGKLPSSERLVACVGTRSPSRWGLEVTRRITRYLVQKDFGIVSGLALGVDALAHRTALEVGGYTIAVLANGLDSIYPLKHSQLAAQILESGGALLSEHPPGTSTTPQALVQRNRIQSGLSLTTVVMQSKASGGSMHTAKFTRVQQRRLFTPEPQGRYALEQASQGNLRLISSAQAIPLRDASDLSMFRSILRLDTQLSLF